MKSRTLYIWPRFISYWETYYGITDDPSGWQEFDIYVKEANGEKRFVAGLCIDTKGYYRFWEEIPPHRERSSEMELFMQGNEIEYRIYYSDNDESLAATYISCEEYEPLLKAKTFDSIGITAMHPTEGGVTPEILKEIAADFAKKYLSFNLEIAYEEIPSLEYVLSEIQNNPLINVKKVKFSSEVLEQMATQTGSTTEDVLQSLQEQLGLDDEGNIIR